MEAAPAIVLTLTLAISSVTDLGSRRIPNLLTGPVAVVAIALALLGLSVAPLEAIAVASMLGLPLAALAIIRPDGFGMGDVKLIVVMALLTGWGVWGPLVAGLGLATVIGLAIGFRDAGREGSIALPLAPFLAAGAVPFAAASLPLLH